MVTFVTTNPGKLREARTYLGDVEGLDYDYPEIQADGIAAVAAHGARAAYRRVGGPVIVDDSGLTTAALDGFPGPYSSYVERTVGIERVADLILREDDHAAAFRGVVAYCDGDPFAATPEPVDVDRDRRGQDTAAEARGRATTDDQVAGDDALPVKLFEGVVPGTIVEPRGEGGFGYDPIFEHGGRTFAEMDTEEKNAVSHRGRALERFAEWHAAADR
ncbi:MAG: non-canonical purine NTP pyrophosphatase [Salinirussus sp.]